MKILYFPVTKSVQKVTSRGIGKDNNNIKTFVQELEENSFI